MGRFNFAIPNVQVNELESLQYFVPHCGLAGWFGEIQQSFQLLLSFLAD